MEFNFKILDKRTPSIKMYTCFGSIPVSGFCDSFFHLRKRIGKNARKLIYVIFYSRYEPSMKYNLIRVNIVDG